MYAPDALRMRFVANRRFAEPFIRLPHVMHGTLPADFMLTNQRRGRLVRAVIGNNDFEVGVVLLIQCAQR